MAIRISETEAWGLKEFHVDGWLEGEEADELLRVARAAEGPRALDLSGLRSADSHGLRVLRLLAEEGVQLQRLSGYLKFQLTTQGAGKGDSTGEGIRDRAGSLVVGPLCGPADLDNDDNQARDRALRSRDRSDQKGGPGTDSR